ncbi:hypothetical protein K7711_38315 [Nocardia sp. CA2R105]|uniref:hypothetical protein n=1 Tax=Nocardia coffeae TaxID=2873381 RepID=UPI001CA64893|nr:hypothetical protein [Nocardia coffeae]MBY8862379.1 hypothetical protein [Nocardia coffeae]
MNEQAAQPDSSGGCPTAIGMVRGEVSGLDAPRHALEVERHATRLGYRYLYTVRPPRDALDPIAYALGIAAGLDAVAVVVYDLAQVDNQPELVCDDFDLETVCPPETWARAAQPAPIESGAA